MLPRAIVNRRKEVRRLHKRHDQWVGVKAGHQPTRRRAVHPVPHVRNESGGPYHRERGVSERRRKGGFLRSASVVLIRGQQNARSKPERSSGILVSEATESLPRSCDVLVRAMPLPVQSLRKLATSSEPAWAIAAKRAWPPVINARTVLFGRYCIHRRRQRLSIDFVQCSGMSRARPGRPFLT